MPKALFLILAKNKDISNVLKILCTNNSITFSEAKGCERTLMEKFNELIHQRSGAPNRLYAFNDHELNLSRENERSMRIKKFELLQFEYNLFAELFFAHFNNPLNKWEVEVVFAE